MGSFSFLTSTLLLWASLMALASISGADQSIRSGRHLDLLIRNYTFQSSHSVYFKTGTPHAVHLPANLSGIRVDAVKFRCGSLRRYGGRVKEFSLGKGVIVEPCVERVMLVRQNLGENWSSQFFADFELSGYQLVSPVLGLLAYNAETDANFTDAFDLGIVVGEKPITIDFRNVTKIEALSGKAPLCARFEDDGKVTLTNQVSPSVCTAPKQGHFGLVIESPPHLDVEPPAENQSRKISRWKVAVGSSIGAVVGVVLLALLLVAMVIKEKKKSKMEELERKAYEEEALQVSMVGHVRAPIAASTRTTPTIEYEYRPPPL